MANESTKVRFESATAAAKWLNRTQLAVSTAAKKGTLCKGYKVEYI